MNKAEQYLERKTGLMYGSVGDVKEAIALGELSAEEMVELYNCIKFMLQTTGIYSVEEFKEKINLAQFGIGRNDFQDLSDKYSVAIAALERLAGRRKVS